MKSILIALVTVLLSIAAPAVAVAANEEITPPAVLLQISEPAPRWEVTSTLRERYVFSTAGVEASSKPGIHTNILYFFQNGCYFNPWIAIGTNGWNRDAGSEIDLGAGCVLKFGQGWTLDLFAAHYNVYDVEAVNNKDIVTVAGELGWPILKSGRHLVNGFTRLELLKLGVTTRYRGDYLLAGGINYRYDQGRFAFRCKLKLVKDPGIFGLDSGLLAGSDCGMDVPLTKSFSLTAGVQVTLPFMADVRKDRAVPYAGFIARF